MSLHWYYAHDGAKIGPVPFDHLRTLANTGVLTGDDMVLNEGAVKWVYVRDVPGLISTASVRPSETRQPPAPDAGGQRQSDAGQNIRPLHEPSAALPNSAQPQSAQPAANQVAESSTGNSPSGNSAPSYSWLLPIAVVIGWVITEYVVHQTRPTPEDVRRRLLLALGPFRAGRAALDRQEFDKAIVNFTEVIRTDPTRAEAYYFRGIAYAKKGDHEKALADRLEAVRLKPALAKEPPG